MLGYASGRYTWCILENRRLLMSVRMLQSFGTRNEVGVTRGMGRLLNQFTLKLRLIISFNWVSILQEKVYEDAEEMAENYRKRLAEMQVEGNFEDEPRMAQREFEPRRAQRESVPRRAQGEYDGRSVGIAEDLDW